MSYAPGETLLSAQLGKLVADLGEALPPEAAEARLAFSRLKRAVRKVERLEAEVDRVRTMLRDTHAVIDDGKLESASEKVLDSVIAILGARRGMVGLELEDGSWRILAGRDVEEQDLSSPEAQISRGVVETVLATGRPVKEDDAVSGEFRDRQSVMAMALRSVLCFPFDVGDDVGFVYVDNHTVRGAFDDDAMRAIEVWIPLLSSCLSRAARS
jgi:hypothetical protein